MKKKTLLFIAIILCMGMLPLSSVFADSDEPQPPDFSGPTSDPSGDEPVEPALPAPMGIYWDRDIKIFDQKDTYQAHPLVKIAYEENDEDACERHWGQQCAENGDGYSYNNGVLTLNNFGQKDKLTIQYTGEKPLEIKLTGDNNFDLDTTLACDKITISGSGTMNGDTKSYDSYGFGCSPDIEFDGVQINAESIHNQFGNIILEDGEIVVVGKITAQGVVVNNGSLAIKSEDTGIEIINRTGYSPSEDSGLTVNGGNVSIVAKEYVINERYDDTTDYDFDKEEWTAVLGKDNSEKLFSSLLSLGKNVGIKENNITLQRYKILNDGIISGINNQATYGLVGQTDEPYTYYASLSYGDYKITKGGSAIRDAVKVINIGESYKNPISKNNNVGVINTLKNVRQDYSWGYGSEEQELKLKSLKVDGKIIDPSKYQTKTNVIVVDAFSGNDEEKYPSLDITLPASTLFEIGPGKHKIFFEFNNESKNAEYNLEIIEDFKNYEYLLTAKDNPILEGEDETLVFGNSTSYRIRFDRNVQLFDGFTIDGKEVPEKFYEIKSGSTVIEISPEFLNTLALGKHEISAKFLAEDEPLSTNFTMTEVKKESKPEDKDKKTTEDKTVNNPGTGLYSKDNSFVGSSTLITVTIVVAVSTIALAIWSIKTKRFKH